MLKHFCKTPTYRTSPACCSTLGFFSSHWYFPPGTYSSAAAGAFLWCIRSSAKRDQIDTRWDVVPSRFQAERPQRMCKYPLHTFPRDLYIEGGGGERGSSTTTPEWETGNHKQQHTCVSRWWWWRFLTQVIKLPHNKVKVGLESDRPLFCNSQSVTGGNNPPDLTVRNLWWGGGSKACHQSQSHVLGVTSSQSHVWNCCYCWSILTDMSLPLREAS